MSNYAEQERAKWWPVSPELMAQYRDGSHYYEDSNGALYWKNKNDRCHRDGDKPAYIGRYILEWCQDGQQHRDGDRPAIIYAEDGNLFWCQHGQTHRLCGPAVIYGDKLEWVIYDENITQEVNEWLAGEEWQGTPEQVERFQRRFT